MVIPELLEGVLEEDLCDQVLDAILVVPRRALPGKWAVALSPVGD